MGKWSSDLWRPTQEGARGRSLPYPHTVSAETLKSPSFLLCPTPHSTLSKCLIDSYLKVAVSEFHITVISRVDDHVFTNTFWDTLFSEAWKYFHLPELLTLPSV